MMCLEHKENKIVNETFSTQVICHGREPKNLGRLLITDGFARVTGPCGDTIEISLKVTNNIIVNGLFQTDGCLPTVACADIAINMIKGKSIGHAQQVSQVKILDALGGLPDNHEHCALLASNTLKEAIKDYLSFKNESWKNVYRKQTNL